MVGSIIISILMTLLCLLFIGIDTFIFGIVYYIRARKLIEKLTEDDIRERPSIIITICIIFPAFITSVLKCILLILIFFK